VQAERACAAAECALEGGGASAPEVEIAIAKDKLKGTV
jgi:hypothetical protein